MQKTDFVATLFHGKDDPAKVTVAFTMALAALGKGHSATLILMVDAVQLGRPGATDGMDIGKPFDPVSEQLKRFVELGGRIALCGACMVHNGLSPQDMDPRFEVIAGPDVIDLLMGAKGSLQVN